MGDSTKQYEDWWDQQAEAHERSNRWPEVRIPFIQFTDSNYAHIRDADDAWQHGLVVFTALFGIWNDASTVVEFAGTHELLDHWTRTLSAIVEIGWRLHTWTPEADGSFYRAFAVFVRPS